MIVLLAFHPSIELDSRTKGIKYEVETISLEDFLEKYNAPNIIDYLSIDTEGSEYEILILKNINLKSLQ